MEVPADLVEGFTSHDLLTYGNARIMLMGHGPYAVPYLLEPLAQSGPDAQMVVARTISLLGQLERDACLPLSAALRGTTNSLLKVRIAGALAQIGDPRAVPALMAVWADPEAGDDAQAAAGQALQSITGKSPDQLGSPAVQFTDIGRSYLIEDRARVGYTYGLSADVWKWNPAGEDLAACVVYETVPTCLDPYQRMATETAMAGLAVQPDSADLQALLVASLVRQLALVRYFESNPKDLNGMPVDPQVVQDAAGRAATLSTQVPVVVRLMGSSVVAQALKLTIEANDGPASLYLAQALDEKLTSGGPGAITPATTEALVAALNSGDKDVRYQAAVALVCANPNGDGLPVDVVMAVINAALSTAAQRNALVVMDNFQMSNKLVQNLRDAGLSTTEAGALEPRIEYALSLQPSVDAIFLQGNITESKYRRMIELIKGDPRTSHALLYVVIDPREDAAKVAPEDGVESVITPDGLRPDVLLPLLQSKVLMESRTSFTPDEEQTVLSAARTLASVNPVTTKYPLVVAEVALIRALRGYSENVTVAAISALGNFGTDAAIQPLSKVVGSQMSVPHGALRPATR